MDCRPTCKQRQGDEGLLPSPGNAQQLPHLGPCALLHLTLVRAERLQAGSRVRWSGQYNGQAAAMYRMQRRSCRCKDEHDGGGGGGGGG